MGGLLIGDYYLENPLLPLSRVPQFGASLAAKVLRNTKILMED